MVKFSILRDEDEEDEDFSIRSPKRRRTTLHSPPSDHHHHHQPLDETNSDDDDADDYSEGPTKSESMPVILSDPDVLDCSICFNPLTLPVFQCDNGHIACSSCCSKLQNKCPSCSGQIGYNRCRAIEKVIESVRVVCCYARSGCSETVSYCEKQAHEETCTYAPCSCPFPDCLYRCSPTRLSLHMTQKHANFVTRFHYDTSFTVSVGLDDKFFVLQEERNGVLFVLSHGNTVTVQCIDPLLSKRRFSYVFLLHKGSSSLRFQSVTDSTTGPVDSPLVDYFLVPGYFYDSSGYLKLEICIWDKEQSQADITQAAGDSQSTRN